MRLALFLCDLMALASTRRILARRLAVSEMVSQSEISRSSGSGHSGIKRNDSNSLFAKARTISRSRRSRPIVNTSLKGPDFANPHLESESHKSYGTRSLKISRRLKLDPLASAAPASQFVQLNYSINVSCNYSSVSIISSIADFASTAYEHGDKLTLKAVMLFVLFFCLGCITNACLQGASENKQASDEEDYRGSATYSSQDSGTPRKPRTVRFSDDLAPTAGSSSEPEEPTGIASRTGAFGTRKLHSVLRKGKEKRGAEADDHYRFGDFARGLFSKRKVEN
mmetsp:Transcript_63330/g.100072  ORF Transcript_63330/g.100072 Transcript_63330/m.100072 type:complete len:282 (+) Transcript_63330:80-925(+)